MSKTWQLPSFSDATSLQQGSLAGESLEDSRLDAFERGYKDGWEDATAVAEREQERLKSELVESLSNLAVPYQEARQVVIAEANSILEAIFAQIVPIALQASLTDLVKQEIEGALISRRDDKLRVHVPAGLASVIETVFPSDQRENIEVCEDPSLLPGQARIDLCNQETALDCHGLAQTIQGLVQDYLSKAAVVEQADG